MDLSIVLPTYNERKNIGILIPHLEDFFSKSNLNGEILVVDDSSPDGTADLSKELNKKYGNIRTIVRKKKEGIGAALREGYDAAKGDIILSMDSDLSLSVDDVPRLLREIENGYDLVLGSRHSEGGAYEKKKVGTKIKSLVSFFGNPFSRFVTGVDVADFSLNFRAMKRDAWRSIETYEKLNVFLLEMIVKFHYNGYKITTIPVSFKDRIYGESKTNLFIQVPSFALMALKYGIQMRFK